MSWYYQPHNQTKAYSLCLFPHYADAASQFVKRMLANQPNTHKLDIRAPLFDIMDELVQCEFVLSSTLHGIIFSDSYGIPNAHVSLSNRVQGGEHKFKDYFQSVKRPFESLNATNLDLANENKTSVEFIRKSLEAYDPSQINLMPFWQSCPIHAEAYNRTREQHVQFARKFAKTFTQVSENRGESFDDFSAQIEKEFPIARS
jgi:pyruvyltransferase